jgi:hypothetical protein
MATAIFIRAVQKFSVEQDQAALNVIRYVEPNALRANLVDKA